MMLGRRPGMALWQLPGPGPSRLGRDPEKPGVRGEWGCGQLRLRSLRQFTVGMVKERVGFV